ncbi:thioredoxin-dependent peroxiredoxin [Trifolium repens]|nr:thioredoxin-dependent peroxiredoxin [Trifolium repens]
MGVVGSMTDRGSNILTVQPRILDIVIGIVDNLVWHKNLPLGAVDVLSFWVESYECTVGFEGFESLDSTGYFFLDCLFWNRGFILIIQESRNRGCWDKRHCGDDSSSHKVFSKKYKLPFTLLSDEGNKVRKERGVPGDFFGSFSSIFFVIVY